ncbi:hypothetical protein AQUCO_03700169v1 [Aquilegia coerulea]|uniref:1-phosphatidylinositol 4-kinase n=1 Tax=Aquilegia coerulea TaxID=218851 RepID=A0A2G5CTW2_AQUCA|nr:hypothetical protein AQUCO_03700169v1 [Aquilegia coerulea]PIA34700.1 hypothetical protein AQUCO_03700169v1 [Aquilegia coerulea]
MSIAEVALPFRDESVVFHGCFHGLPDSSILIFVSVSGSLIPMRVLKSDSIESVKLRIQTFKGFVPKKQKLVYEGRELARNDTLVRDYGVTDGNVLHLVVRISDLRAISVKTTSGKEYEFHVERCRNVGYVKKQIAEKEEDLDVKDQELTCYGQKLEDQCLIDDICKYNDDVIHLLVKKSAKVRVRPFDKDFELTITASSLSKIRSDVVEVVEDGKGCRTNDNDLQGFTKKSSDRGVCLEPVIVNGKVELSPAIMEMIDSTYAGLEKGNQPIRSSEGSGGVYFMKDSSDYKFVSVFKPIDEEPMAVNNPRGLPLSSDGEGLKKGTRVGEGALREVAAYILDYPKSGRQSFSNEEMGFSGVPPTTMVRCLHSAFNHPEGNELSTKNIKVGSLQKFMTNNGSCEDMGPQAFPVQEVHKIAVLDMRLANTDRHAGNILIKKDQEDSHTVLIPIDHGYCLPDNFEDCTFDWLYWPQARQPFNSDTIDYIRSLDAEEDIALLNFYGWELPLECARILRISTMLLKKGAERGLTPFAIGSIMCRETLKKESVIEEIVCEAQDSVLPGTSEAVFLESVSQIMDRRLDEITI